MVRILVVDDDPGIREMLHSMFECVGYNVLEAANGIEALKTLHSSEEQLVVLLDLTMPHMDGMDVLHAVAADTQLATRHSYILVSASRDLATLHTNSTITALSVPIIQKPFAMKQLVALVANAAKRLEHPDEVPSPTRLKKSF